MEESKQDAQPHAPLVSATIDQQLSAHLTLLYGAEQAAIVKQRLAAMLAQFAAQHPRASAGERGRVTAADAMVITYGDQLSAPGMYPLEALQGWLETNLAGSVSSVHILPFYPYTSDDGFSVVDYNAVDPALGTWKHVEAISQRFKVMYDAVINHISAQSDWFQGFLKGDPRYADYFVVIDDPAVDLSLTTRPRTHPLLTTFETATGPHRVWTTFSTDQIDLNVANPDVLLAIVDVLLGLRRAWRTLYSAGCDWIPVENTGDALDPPSRNTRCRPTDPVSVRRGRARRIHHHRNQRAARR